MSDVHSRDTRLDEDPTPYSLIPPVPSRVGDIAIHEPLGQGGMGTVYAATQISTGKSVAVKVLLPKNSQDEQVRRRFLREARAGAMLKGPHIVPVIGMIENENSLYLVMERIRGGNLRDWLNAHKKREISWVISIARQIAQGLATAHAVGIFHRDIKPSNILLDEDGKTAYIGDFGLALLSNLPDGLTSTGRPLGAPNYMSPEQVRGQPTDHRSDLFSLGCLIYAMISGESPFVAPSIATITWRIVEVDPPSLHSIDPRVTPFLSQIVSRLLQKDPVARYASAEEVVDALDKCLDVDPDATYEYSGVSMPPLTIAPSSTHDTVVMVPRRRWTSARAGMLVMSLLVVVTVGMLAIYSLRPPIPHPDDPPDKKPNPPAIIPPVIGPVSLTVAQSGEANFHSITEALKAAKPGDEITVLDASTYAETVVIDEPIRLRGIRLVSGKRAKIVAPADIRLLGTLSIKQVREVRVEGFEIEGGTEAHAVYIDGDVAGGSLRDLVITQPPQSQWANVMLARKCAGAAEAPLIFRACRIATGKYGIFSGREDIPDAMECRHVWLDGNEFHGDGTHVELAHSASDVTIEYNVFRGGDGIVLRLPAAPASASFRITNNSFFEIRNWLQLEPMVAVYSGQAMNNLIVAPRALVWTPKLRNFTDRWRFGSNLAETPEAIDIQPFGAGILDAMLQSRVPGDEGFLRPLPNSPAATGGVGDGLPGYVGARRPR
ncbi:MAG: protein kinase [Planctomycetes bacterium]|nr:protein kinase [Planctomycetota bacterium]